MAGGKLWTPEDDAELTALLSQGATLRQATECIGRGAESVRGRLRTLRERGHRVVVSQWTAAMDATLCDLVKTGITIRAMAKTIGVTESAVQRRIATLERIRVRPRYVRSVSKVYAGPPHGKNADKLNRQNTICFELHYCDWADRNGAAIHGYRAAA